MNPTIPITERFRHYLPVAIDIETGGFDDKHDALLEIAAFTVNVDAQGNLTPLALFHEHIIPFEGANLNPSALAFNKIDPYHPFRHAITEATALNQLFRLIRQQLKTHHCSRAIMVAHNAAFDQKFLQQAILRNHTKRSPFHPFSTIDTVGLAAVMLGHTVLAEACKRAGIEFDETQAHSAYYDAERTTMLFCHLANSYPWPHLNT